MAYLTKNWVKNEIYNFASEFYRIESYTQYCCDWLIYFGLLNQDNILIKLDWNNNSIPDLIEYNRVKRNLNFVSMVLDEEQTLQVLENANQKFTHDNANEMEKSLKNSVEKIGNWQFAYQISGISICGNNDRLAGVN